MHIMETYLPGVNVIHSGDTTLQMTHDAIFHLTDKQVIDVTRWFLYHHNDLVNIALFIEFGEGEFYGEYTRNLAELCRNETVKKLAREAMDKTPPKQPRKPKKERVPGSLRKQIFERDAYRCQTCDSWESLTVDHIIPESKGGTLAMDNLQTLCRSCNSKKGNRIQ